MARILIAGCGYVGSALASVLLNDGHTVYGLRRNPENLPVGVKGLGADLSNPQSLHHLPEELDQVVYAASASSFTPEGYRASYVDGTRNLLEALQQGNQVINRVVFTSATSVYGQLDGSWIDESSQTTPLTFGGRTLLEAEALLRSGPYPATIIRFGGIYGPGRDRLIQLVLSGQAQTFDDAPVFTNRIHRDDCAGAIKHLLGLENAAPLYLGVDSEPASRDEVLQWIANKTGVGQLPRRPASERPERKRPGNKRCSNKRLLETDYSFHYPTYREGLSALLDQGTSQISP